VGTGPPAVREAIAGKLSTLNSAPGINSDAYGVNYGWASPPPNPQLRSNPSRSAVVT